MNAARDIDPIPLDHFSGSNQPDDAPTPIEPQPSLEDLTPEASGRIVRYIVTSTLEHGVAPTAVVALYADLAGDDLAVRYADRRFMLREVPADWRDVENRVVDLEEGASLPSTAPAVVDEVVRRDRSRRVWAAIDQLPRQQRAAMVLKFSEDRKIEEIAQILGKSSGAVKLLLHRAVERLRRELPPEFEIGVT